MADGADGADDDGSVAKLIRRLDLVPHPEGGHYREVIRSERRVTAVHGERDAYSLIDFLLPAGAHSRWHRLRSDECWHFQAGAPLELWVAAADGSTVERRVLGAVAEGHRPWHFVPAGSWQSARSMGDYTLVGCSVAPGFEFADFELLAEDHPAAVRLRRRLTG